MCAQGEEGRTAARRTHNVLECWIVLQWRNSVEKVQRGCSIIGVCAKCNQQSIECVQCLDSCVDTSPCQSSRALVFSGWSSFDCEKSLSRPAYSNTFCVPATRGPPGRARDEGEKENEGHDSCVTRKKRNVWRVWFYICVYMYIYIWIYANTWLYV